MFPVLFPILSNPFQSTLGGFTWTCCTQIRGDHLQWDSLVHGGRAARGGARVVPVASGGETEGQRRWNPCGGRCCRGPCDVWGVGLGPLLQVFFSHLSGEGCCRFYVSCLAPLLSSPLLSSSTTSSGWQCFPPDLNRELRPAVRRASTASQKIWQIDRQTECEKEFQKICQKECLHMPEHLPD